MVKVQLPKVEEETRAELNIIKARRKDKSLDETLNYLINSEKQYYSPENITIVVKSETLDKLKKYDTEDGSSWDELLNRLIDEIQNNKLDLTYEELDALVSISIAVDGGDDLEFMKNCRSGAMKLKTLMGKMKEEKE